MTDFEKMKELFDSIGLKYTIDERNNKDGFSLSKKRNDEESRPVRYFGKMITLTIDQGVGYSGFECTFDFSEDGKFLVHGCWE